MSVNEGWMYVNGALVTADDARVPAADEGLAHGRGVFETFRARQGSVYRLDRHLARLRADAEELAIAFPPELRELEAMVRELVRHNGILDARVRLTLTAGPPGGRPSVVMLARAATDYPDELYDRGMSALIAPVRRNETSPLSRIKSLNCLDNVMSREWARAAGADTALLLNTRSFLAEGSTSNVFLVLSGALATPPLADGALGGVTREAVMELAAGAGVKVSEASLTPEDLQRADEAFLTGAVMGVMPLTAVDRSPVGPGEPGKLTLRLRALYGDAAARPS
ncbi:MAG: aminotransferase class IV [Dehalococcoidia bacterium]|nr:aminotransferase class IV [Dehalococcoidia bacterium]